MEMVRIVMVIVKNGSKGMKMDENVIKAKMYGNVKFFFLNFASVTPCITTQLWCSVDIWNVNI